MSSDVGGGDAYALVLGFPCEIVTAFDDWR